MGNTNRVLMYFRDVEQQALAWQIILQEDCWQDKTYRLKSSDKCNSTDHSFVKADRTAAEKTPCGRVRLQTAWWNSRDAQGISGGLEKCQK